MFASFTDQETLRRKSDLVAGGAESSVAEQGNELIAGEDAGDVTAFAEELGFNAPS